MATKMKGLLKGLRYISQIFENEKQQEMQIGFPTDVKHVAHIGWDGPSTVHSPSWMNEFNSPGLHSAPISQGVDNKQNPPDKWDPEDSSQRSSQELSELPKSLRRQSFAGAPSADSPGSDSSNKPRQTRRHQSASCSSSPAKESSNRTRSTQELVEPSSRSEPVRLRLPDLPKKSRRKKSKDSSAGGSTRSKNRSQVPVNYISPFSDPGSGSGSASKCNGKELCPTSPLDRREFVEGKDCNVIS